MDLPHEMMSVGDAPDDPSPRPTASRIGCRGSGVPRADLAQDFGEHRLAGRFLILEPGIIADFRGPKLTYNLDTSTQCFPLKSLAYCR
jgi:hypothetical protein